MHRSIDTLIPTIDSTSSLSSVSSSSSSSSSTSTSSSTTPTTTTPTSLTSHFDNININNNNININNSTLNMSYSPSRSSSPLSLSSSSNSLSPIVDLPMEDADSNDLENWLVSEMTCSLCLSVFHTPVTIPCGHTFCQNCVLKHQEINSTTIGQLSCPLCREVHHVDVRHCKASVVIQQVMKRLLSVHLADRELERKSEDEERTFLVERCVIVGNTHEYVPDGGNCRHRWVLYVRVAPDSNNNNDRDRNHDHNQNHNHSRGDEIAIVSGDEDGSDDNRSFTVLSNNNYGNRMLDGDELIDRVAIYLHPTFVPNVICLTRPPFEVPRLGWATFDVDVVVHFAPQLGIGSREFTHRLSFFGDGDSTTFKILVDRRKLMKQSINTACMVNDHRSSSSSSSSSSSTSLTTSLTAQG